MTQALIRFLLPATKGPFSAASSENTTPKNSIIVPLLGHQQETEAGVVQPTSLRLLLTTPTHTVHRYWRKFDNAFMRPVFGGRGFVPYVPGSPTERTTPPYVPSSPTEKSSTPSS